MTEQLTLGVIGHVDHGKTALVRALTGIETDRLREEQERGLSIVLGFSYLDTPRGIIDLIDVPGHEDFIRAMISGATGIDGVVLVVAANESIMPQTREHFDIARILEVDRGIVVISKMDLASDDELALVTDDIRAFAERTFLANAPIVSTSAVTGAGIDDLRQELQRLAERPIQRPEGRDFYLPVDRVFTMRGFGLVVTGTLRDGALRVNDKVQVMPSGQPATVRGLQNHNKPVDAAYPGQRVAVNLRNIKREDVRRGDTVASPGFLAPTRRIDAELTLLEHQTEGLRNGVPVRLLLGTTEAIAKVRLLDRPHLEPGASALVQLRCDREIATRQSERFIIRSYSPMRTIGGGRILDVNPTRHRRFDEAVTARLKTTAAGDPLAIVKGYLAEAGPRGITMNELAERSALAPGDLAKMMKAAGAVPVNDEKIVEKASYEALLDEIVNALEQHHDAEPQQRGLAAGSLRSRVSDEPDDEIFRQAVANLTAQGKIAGDHGILHIAGFNPLAALSDREQKLAVELETAFLGFGLAPPSVDVVLGRDREKRDMYRLLTESGRLVRLRTYDRSVNLALHADTLEQVKQRLKESYPHPNKFAVSDVRDLLGSTRKHVVPLMEHLDATGVTIRMGDVRQLRVG